MGANTPTQKGKFKQEKHMLILGIVLLILGLVLGTIEVRSDSNVYALIKSLNTSQNNLSGILIACGAIGLILHALIS